MAILADLMGCFKDKRENVATKALGAILRNSAVSRRCFLKFCSQSGVQLPDNLTFRTQESSESNGQPDMVGVCEDGVALVIESKFDAGLTEHQPVSYFAHLNVPGLLLFIVPEYRKRSVWFQLCQRCREKGLNPEEISHAPWEFLAHIGMHRMGLVSWRSVLSFLIDGAKEWGDLDSAQDLSQLKGLCNRFDEDAFRPFQHQDLTDVPRRFIQLMGLPAKVVERASDQNICKAGMRTSGDLYQGSFLWIGPLYGYLGCFLSYWKEHGISPLWFQTQADYKENNGLSAAARKHLKSILSLGCMDSSKFPIEDGKYLAVPMRVLPNVEEQEVVADLVQQLAQLREALLRVDFVMESTKIAATHS